MSREETDQLVRETMELTGSPLPALMDNDEPVLREEIVGPGMYLVGLIGGKEVGKSALVNALAGAAITEETSHGPGTQMVVAFVHRPREKELAELLQREVPGRFRIVPHDQAHLGAQVLLDLPDIDSRHSSHVEITRRMLRHMLFPLWIQSIEKYADAQPQNLLAKVAAGNDPANFLFCLNKADQVPDSAEVDSVRRDYAVRIARVLSLDTPPKIYLISAKKPAAFDLPQLQRLLSREKSTEMVADSRQRAGRRRQRSLLAWLAAQDLPGRAQRLGRLDDEATELLSQRVGVPLLETAVPAMIDDPAYRQVMREGVLARRIARWPIVNVLYALLAPLRLVIRENAASGSFFGGAEALVDSHLKLSAGPVSGLVQSVFAQLHQSDPAVASLYARRKLWDSMEAEAAQSAIRRQLVETIDRQRQEILSRLSGRAGIIAPPIRVLLTIGALIWFPFVQPVLHAFLASNSVLGTARDIGILAVEVFSAQSLLLNGAFLLLWYLIIMALVKWNARRRVDRLLARWKSAEYADPALNLSTAALQWMDDLLEPIHGSRQAMERLAGKVADLEAELGADAKSAA